MKILRSKGTSYTRFEGRKILRNPNAQSDENGIGDAAETQQLPSRGLLLKPESQADDSAASRSIWDSTMLPDQLEADRDLALRQYIQWLDKALRKPRSLKHFDVPSYVARTHLGTCLWEIFANAYLEEVPSASSSFKRYRARWNAKVHPYARHEVIWETPDADGNAKFILTAREGEATSSDRSFSHTPWTSVFRVPIGQLDVESYREAAEAIDAHLRVQELTITGEQRRSKKRPSGYGLINKRGEIITLTATDPRANQNFETYRTWSDDLAKIYFSHGDVARKIATDFRANPQAGKPSKRFGAALHDHFKPIVTDEALQNQRRQEMWNLHNRIRHFYRTLAESRRLLEALRTNDQKKLRFLLPQDSRDLLNRVLGKRDASQLGRKIRLGKVIAHSIDLCSDRQAADFDRLVREAMDYYVTSIGQSDIKRNEAFVRVLRTAVAFSMRSHSTWLEEGLKAYLKTKPKQELSTFERAENRDLSIAATAAGAIEHMPPGNIMPHARLIFGSKPHDFKTASTTGNMTSRTDVLFDGTETDREVLWGLLRLAGQVRNRSYHFNTKKRLLNALENRLLRSPVNKGDLKSFSTRAANIVETSALSRLERLLDYDLQLDARILAETLNMLRFHVYTPADRSDDNLKTLSRPPASDDRVTPKFMMVLKKAQSLASNDNAALVPALLKPFSALQLHDLSKDQNSTNHDSVGILRLLYDRAFPNWLETIEDDEMKGKRIFREILENKRTRRDEFLKVTGRMQGDDETLAESLLSEAVSVSGVEMAFMAEALLASGREPEAELIEQPAGANRETTSSGRASNPYVPDRTRQSEESSALESLRQEVYAYLFAHFIQESRFDWLWNIPDLKGEAYKSVDLSGFKRVRHEDVVSETKQYPAWLRQFYAWLYLVPSDYVAQLQHQFRKTRVLEEKARLDRASLFGTVVSSPEGKGPATSSARETLHEILQSNDGEDERLRELDRVMGLYTRVHSAGFAGEEFEIAKRYFSDENVFDALFSNATADQTLMLPGTRSGLRQLARFGTLDVLNSTFVKHRVTVEEATSLREIVKDQKKAPFTTKLELQSKLQALWKEKPRNDSSLRQAVEAYREVSGEACRYNFDISAARLADFANTHHLLMSILGRLADFTAIWERDRDCVLLALAFEEGRGLEFVKREKGAVHLKLPMSEATIEVYTGREGFMMMHRRSDFLAFTKCAELAGCSASLACQGSSRASAPNMTRMWR